MKNRINFNEMQSFITCVATNTLIHGFGYKQFYTDLCTYQMYGEKTLIGTEENPRNMSEVYEEFNTEEYRNVLNNVDKAQYETILKAIDEEIAHKCELMCIPVSQTDESLASLIEKVNTILTKFDEDYDEKTVKDFMGVIANNKDNFSLDKIITSLTKTQKKITQKKTAKTKAKKDITVTTN